MSSPPGAVGAKPVRVAFLASAGLEELFTGSSSASPMPSTECHSLARRQKQRSSALPSRSSRLPNARRWRLRVGIFLSRPDWHAFMGSSEDALDREAREIVEASTALCGLRSPIRAIWGQWTSGRAGERVSECARPDECARAGERGRAHKSGHSSGRARASALERVSWLELCLSI
jgi:hypothetical protein